MAEQQFYMMLTEAGHTAYRDAANGKSVEFSFAAVGDGGGHEITPAENWTSLVNERWRGAPILLEPDPQSSRIMIIEVYIPHSVGGFDIREVALFNPDGVMLAVGKWPASYKPSPDSGAMTEFRARLKIEHSNSANTVLKIDPTIVMASRNLVENDIEKHNRHSDAHKDLFAAVASGYVQKNIIVNTDAPLTGGGTLATDITIGLDVDALPKPLATVRDVFAGTIQAWPSLYIPILGDGKPLGLSLDGAVASLEIYPRLERVLCAEADNAWIPSWYRCNASGVRGISPSTHKYIKLDDWRGGFPRGLDMGRGVDTSIVLLNIVNGSNVVTITNNLSGGGTYLAPLLSSEGCYPGVSIVGYAIPTGTTIVAVSDMQITLSANCTATGPIGAALIGRVLGSWQSDTTRQLTGTTNSGVSQHAGSGVFSWAGHIGSIATGGGSGVGYCNFDTARQTPVGNENRPVGPTAHYIILI